MPAGTKAFNFPVSTQPLPDDRFVFANGNLYSARIDGTEVRKLGGKETPIPHVEPGRCRYPSISPDRRTIAYNLSQIGSVSSDEGEEAGKTETAQCLFLMSSDGKKLTDAVSGSSPPAKYGWDTSGTGLYLSGGFWIDFDKLTRSGVLGHRSERFLDLSFALSPSGKEFAYWGTTWVKSARRYESRIFRQPLEGRDWLVGEPTEVVSQENKTPWIVWINENELLAIDEEMGQWAHPSQSDPEGKVQIPTPYRSHIYRIDTGTGSKQLVAQSEPWEIWSSLSMSPDRARAMFNYHIQNHDPAHPYATYHPGGDPMPAILDLATGQVTRLPKTPELNYALDVNWTSP